MVVTPTNFPDLLIVEPRVFGDSRGFFFESYNAAALAAEGVHYKFVQDNHSKSTFGVLRGLHFQRGIHAQTKLVRVTAGAVLDVVVDLRKGSPTYLEHFSLELSGENKKQLLIPKGFAHGFVVLTPSAEFLYKCDQFYNPAHEGGILYNDPALNIDWGLQDGDYIIGEKDLKNPLLEAAEYDFPFGEYTESKLYGE